MISPEEKAHVRLIYSILMSSETIEENNEKLERLRNMRDDNK